MKYLCQKTSDNLK